MDFEQKLIGIVSHDLRNPLSAILMGVSLLMRREDLDARTTRSPVLIQAAAERASRMVKDLLDFTQVQCVFPAQLRRPRSVTVCAVQEPTGAGPLPADVALQGIRIINP